VVGGKESASVGLAGLLHPHVDPLIFIAKSGGGSGGVEGGYMKKNRRIKTWLQDREKGERGKIPSHDHRDGEERIL